MLAPLTDVEVRVLGSLLEKEVTTPDTYPLTLSALTAACNQTSNRDPVMRLAEGAVSEAVVHLRRRDLLRSMQPAGSRVTKYNHLLADALHLDERALAVLGVLMLRGPQTPGELHARTARLADFDDIAAIESTLDALIAREPDPLVVRLPRRAGQKEVRYAHLLAGEVVVSDTPEPPNERETPARSGSSDDTRIAALERTVDELRTELTTLRAEFLAFRAQLE